MDDAIAASGATRAIAVALVDGVTNRPIHQATMLIVR